MMRTLIINIFILSICVVGLGGATCQSQNPELQLPERVRLFNSNVRWQRFDDAAKCVLPKDRNHFLRTQKQRARVIRTIDFEIIGIQKSGPELAEVQVSLHSQHQQNNVINTDFVRQIWEKVGNTWFVTKIEIIKEPAPSQEPGGSFGLD